MMSVIIFIAFLLNFKELKNRKRIESENFGLGTKWDFIYLNSYVVIYQ